MTDILGAIGIMSIGKLARQQKSAGWTPVQTRHAAPVRATSLALRVELERLGTAGNLTTDAHLAVLAIERGYVLHTTDADFARFPELRWINPCK